MGFKHQNVWLPLTLPLSLNWEGFAKTFRPDTFSKTQRLVIKLQNAFSDRHNGNEHVIATHQFVATRKILEMFVSVREIHMEFSFLGTDLADLSQSYLWQKQKSLWHLFSQRQCLFTLSCLLLGSGPLNLNLPKDLLKPLRGINVGKMSISAQSAIVAQTVFEQLESGVDIPVNLQQCLHMTFDMPVRVLARLQKQAFRTCAITTIRTSLGTFSDLYLLLGILRSTAPTLRRIDLQEPNKLRITNSLVKSPLMLVRMPYLYILKLADFDPLSFSLLRHLEAPSLRVFDFKVEDWVTSDPHGDLVSFLRKAVDLSLVQVQCFYDRKYGDGIIKFLNHLKDNIDPSVRFDIILSFGPMSWTDLIRTPSGQRYLVPLLGNITILQGTPRTRSDEDEDEPDQYMLPRLHTYILDFPVLDFSIDSFQHHFDSFTSKRLIDLHITAHGSMNADHWETHSCLSYFSDYFGTQIQKWPTLETFEMQLGNDVDKESTHSRLALEKFSRACERSGVIFDSW